MWTICRLWCVFNSFLNTHSDGTHLLLRIHIMLHFSTSVLLVMDFDSLTENGVDSLAKASFGLVS